MHAFFSHGTRKKMYIKTFEYTKLMPTGRKLSLLIFVFRVLGPMLLHTKEFPVSPAASKESRRLSFYPRVQGHHNVSHHLSAYISPRTTKYR